MIRPLKAIARSVSFDKYFRNFVRNKVVYPESVLTNAEKIKLYNKVNKELFGPLLETNKQKKQRLQNKVKKSSASNSKKTVDATSDVRN